MEQKQYEIADCRRSVKEKEELGDGGGGVCRSVQITGLETLSEARVNVWLSSSELEPALLNVIRFELPTSCPRFAQLGISASTVAAL